MQKDTLKPQIVIIGGGAGGLELATQLGKKFGKQGKAVIKLVDCSPTHVWKPLLHEVAAGTLGASEDQLNYLAYASSQDFRFYLGTFQHLNRAQKTISLAPILDEHQQEIIPQRSLSYDILIIAVGSNVNDFGTPGVREHCLFLDSAMEANYFHQFLLKNMLHLSYQPQQVFNIAIVGGGATGVELAAELHYVVREMASYGFEINPENITFSLIEAADRLVSALSPRVSAMVLEQLQSLGVRVYTDERVSSVTAEGLFTQTGKFIPADLKVWAAGIKAPDFLRDLDGLEVNQINQLRVKQTLQTTADPTIFALGDCACCPQNGSDKPVPPRAQAAHQQASFLVKALSDYLTNKPLPLYRYQDYGSLISLGHHQAIGNLMSRISKNMLLEGMLARVAYRLLYKKHQVALYGVWRVCMLTLANLLSRRVRPRLKLH